MRNPPMPGAANHFPAARGGRGGRKARAGRIALAPAGETCKEHAVAGILIVDDESANRRILRAILERDQHTVWEAASVNQAFEVLEKKAAPDLVIIDLRLESESGVEILRRLRADPIYGPLPVLFCSGTPDRSAVMETAQLGVSGFLTKPLDPLRLRVALGKVLGSSWMRGHFEDPVSVCGRLHTDREKLLEYAHRFFIELANAVDVGSATEKERAAVQPQIPALHREASNLGLRVLLPALEQWEKAEGGASVPALLHRSATIGRLFEAFVG